ncbi:hypothetical protein HS088_TW18G00227 [Tripterygium wilfordii]|uniref:F-box domain-containing protein n=2 Tax=Tripterygium wilfordii TaxID=458696 RepID=A0A7J7CCF1_TRIWF|nr:hypothetical protein HS088_TW18G00227 [Tripterygium wilfordii]
MPRTHRLRLFGFFPNVRLRREGTKDLSTFTSHRRFYAEDRKGLMAKYMGTKNPNLLRLVEERALSKKTEEDHKKVKETIVPDLPIDCVTRRILLRLPVESLQRCKCVCKPWNNVINDRVFINDHMLRSEYVLIFRGLLVKKRSSSQSSTLILQQNPNTFSVEKSLLQSKNASMFGFPMLDNGNSYEIQFMAFKEGENCEIEIGEFRVSCMGDIRATCNGLILLDNGVKKGGLIVMNPVTKKLIELPLGTLWESHKESYALAKCNVTGDYKVVHLFRERYGNVSCEILNLRDGFWRPADGPSIGNFVFLGFKPVLAIGAFHWVPQVEDCDFLVSMEVSNEKFHIIQLPKICGAYDRLVEMSSCLCFVSHEGLSIDIWILKGLHEKIWTKQHSVTSGSILDMVPLLSLRNSGEMIFMRDEGRAFYAYDFNNKVMKKIERENKRLPWSNSYLPHVNSLSSWD